MIRLLIAAIVLSLTAGAANATHKSKHKVKTVRHYAPIVHATVVDPYAAYYLPGPRPAWAAPWQCFTDEGYGRYRPCDAGPSTPSR